MEKGRANLLKTTKITTSVTETPATSPTPSAEVQSGTTAIKAPMPGTVLDIKVVPGRSIKKGEALLILEAMKMENEVTAPSDGVIAQVLVTKGNSVATDDILISIQ